jgi:hypothetical protein
MVSLLCCLELLSIKIGSLLVNKKVDIRDMFFNYLLGCMIFLILTVILIVLIAVFCSILCINHDDIDMLPLTSEQTDNQEEDKKTERKQEEDKQTEHKQKEDKQEYKYEEIV